VNHLGNGVAWFWKVVVMNEKMGFQKSFTVEATNYLHAVSEAGEQLRGSGYNADDFVATSVVRERVTKNA
jgi:hypothetical protein